MLKWLLVIGGILGFAILTFDALTRPQSPESLGNVLIGVLLFACVAGLGLFLPRRRGNSVTMRMPAVLVVLGVAFVAPSGANAQSWVDELYGKKPSAPPTQYIFESTCNNLEEFTSTWWNFPFLRKHGPTLASSLLKVFDELREERVAAGECVYWFTGMRRSSFSFADGSAVMDLVARVLKQSGFRPEDIGRRPPELRDIVKKDIVQYVQEARKLGRDAWVSRPGSVSQSVNAGIKKWNFTPQELGLNQDEVALLKK